MRETRVVVCGMAAVLRRVIATAAAIAAVAMPRPAAGQQIFSPPVTATQQKTDLFGVRFRAFNPALADSETQVFLGLPNLADGTNTRAKYRWGTAAGVTVVHLIAFTWDPVNDKLIAVLEPATQSRARRRRRNTRATTLEFTGVRAKVAAKFPGFSVDDLNVLSLVVANRDPPSTVALNDIVFNGQSLGSVTAPGFNTFNGIGVDFTRGFTLTGTLVLTGAFGGRENSRVEILAAVAACTTDADCDDGLACQGVETCDLATFRCAPGTPVSCTGECDTGVCLDPDGVCEQRPGCPSTTTTSTTSTSTTTSSGPPTTSPESTSTTTIPTSTTTTSTAPLPPLDPCAAACGNGVVDPACGEVCDGADLGGATCPPDRPVGAPVCTAACRRIDYGPCMPSPAQEICGNCFDDDGDGLTDFEDPACCATRFESTIQCSTLRPAGEETRLNLRSALAASPAEIVPDVTEVYIQLRQPGGAELLCARIPAGDFVAVPRGFDFRDPKGTVASAQGIDQIIVRDRAPVTLAGAFARRAAFATPPPGDLVVTLGLFSRTRQPAAGACSSTTAPFVPAGGGTLASPDASAANDCPRPAAAKPPPSSGCGDH